MNSLLISFLISLLLTLSTTSEISMFLAEQKQALQEFANSNNLFAGAVYKQVKKDNSKNFLFSPFSAVLILALTHSGSKDDTALEIQRALYIPDNEIQKIGPIIKQSLLFLTPSKKHYTLKVVNKIYVNHYLPIERKFRISANMMFGADVENINFRDQVNAAQIMNEWVEWKTNKKIQNLIDPETISQNTQMILINALYYKNSWLTQFNKNSTKEEEFYETADKTTMVTMMHQREQYYNYFESQKLNAKFLELPFLGKSKSMVIILPNEIGGLANLEEQLDEVLMPLNLTKTFVNIAIPKFRIENTIDLKNILINLGIKKAFSGADFSGIAGGPGQLKIDDVVQRTVIEVAEEGIEAAASTKMEVHPTAFEEKPTPIDFTANHPFLFYIKNEEFIIFIGRVLLPQY